MADLVVVGSMALDSVKTPFGAVERVVGGAAVYASAAASLLARPGVVGVVGGDFPQEALDRLQERGADLTGVQRVSHGRSFFWSGVYDYSMSERQTLVTELNVFADFDPKLPESYRDSRYCFLANIQPQVQLAVLEQLQRACFVMCDTMNLWIETERAALAEVLARADLALLNDSEVRQLAGTPNLAQAAQRVLDMGPRFVVIKKGEYGAALVSHDDYFSIPSYPLPNVVDPTGAGDSFAGGMIGLLARQDDCCNRELRRAVAFGTVIASACVEGFSLDGLWRLDHAELCRRYDALRDIVRFEAMEWAEFGAPEEAPGRRKD
ncbi:MAG: PfkB family carbohydrate kinase [Armatimonadota bacterium]